MKPKEKTLKELMPTTPFSKRECEMIIDLTLKNVKELIEKKRNRKGHVDDNSNIIKEILSELEDYAD